jgi:hypothetical protein
MIYPNYTRCFPLFSSPEMMPYHFKIYPIYEYDIVIDAAFNMAKLRISNWLKSL